MAVAQLLIPAAPAAVWAVLADAERYADWVLGAHQVRAVEGGWPATGSRIHHSVGTRVLRLNDNTEVLASEPERLLRLRAKIRPIGVATVELRLEARDGGTLVTMEEHPQAPAPLRTARWLVDMAILPRNRVSLKRLGELATQG